MTTCRFFFDPTCPWTWMTSRWLVTVAADEAMDIQWQPLSLALLNGRDDPASEVPEAWAGREVSFREQVTAGITMLRVVSALADDGDDDCAGAFYSEWGRRVFAEGAQPTVTLVEHAANAVGVSERHRHAASDERRDVELRRSCEEATELAGPDVGSPVLVVPGASRGVFGPIVSPPPTGEDARKLWRAVAGFAHLPAVYELKHGRPADGPHVTFDRPAAG